MKDRYPLPIIEEVLEQLYNAKVFSILDLKNGFLHVDIEESSKKYTAFVTPDGHFEFNKVPFGLCNSPAVFQRYVNVVLQDLKRQGVVLAYIDDLIIPARSKEEGIQKLKEVLKVSEENGLIINWSKCAFLQTEVKFLGHIIRNGSIRPSEEKTFAVKHFPVLKNIKSVMQFLGLTGYFRKFIPGYATIAKPLSDLTKQDATFIWGPSEENAYIKLKELLCQEPVLKLFNPDLQSQLHTDASKEGLGAVLVQKHDDGQYHPVFFLSFKTTDSEKKIYKL